MEPTTPPSAERPRGGLRKDRRTALLLALVTFAVFNANLRTISQGDCFPARFLPFLLWSHGTLHLDPLAASVAEGFPDPYWIRTLPDGHQASLYPVVTPVVVAPLYLPAVLYLNAVGWSEPGLSALAEIMEKLAASAVAALGVALLYLTLRRTTSAGLALLLSLAYAFGTNTWTISSQALWQHGTAQLFVILALGAVTAPASAFGVGIAGLALGLLPANRPPDLFLALGFLPFAWVWCRGRRTLFVAMACLAPLLVAAYNLAFFHQLTGGYGAIGLASSGSDFFGWPIAPGVAALLVSPARGLFVYSPFLLFLAFAPFGAARLEARGRPRLLVLGLAASVVLQILFYARTDWRGGSSWGYRFLTDLVPILVWLLAPVVATLGPRRRAVFVAACLVSVWIQTIGAFRYAGESDLTLFAAGDRKISMSIAWNPRLSPIRIESRRPWAHPSLLDALRRLGPGGPATDRPGATKGGGHP